MRLDSLNREERTSKAAKSAPSHQRQKRLLLYAVNFSIIGNIFLFVIKYAVGVMTGSVALKADAWHTLSDILTSIIVLVGYRIARKPPDKDHPFGHGRYELVATMLVGVFLVLVAVMFFYEGFQQFISRTRVSFGPWAIAVTIISIAVKELTALYSFKVAKIVNNSSLEADGWHHRSDALSSLIILVGILFADYFWWMDSVLGIAVAILIGWVAIRTVRDAASAIVGEAPPEDLQNSIIETVKKSFPELELHPHNFRWHNYIQRQEITLHIVLPLGTKVEEAYQITSTLKDKVLEEFCIFATFHVEPISSYKRFLAQKHENKG